MNMYIFSYGSNMLTARIKQRVNDYRKICIGYLPKYSLRFHKKSKDGSGKADAYFTDNKNDIVWGVVGYVDMEAKKLLDKFEGLGKGYGENQVEIINNEEKIFSTIYVADLDHIDSDLLPFDWYKDFVLQGCIENELPKDYIDAVVKIPCIKDFDTQRRQRNYSIIKKAGT